MAKVGTVVKGAIRSFFEYDTPKIVHIKSLKVGFMNRAIQLMILGYIIVYAIVLNKGYQEFDEVVSACSTKLKGVTYTNITTDDGVYQRVWDVADYVIPPQENNAFFVMTNAIITREQTQGKCDEDPTKPNVLCLSDVDCVAGEAVEVGNGIRTGRCVNSTFPGYENQTVCEIYAWCPVEQDNEFPSDKPLLLGSENFTVLLKNQIEFPKFGVRRRNILDTQNETYLQSCHYDADSPVDRLCPIFRLGDIVQLTDQSYESIAQNGGFIAIHVAWNCDLDKGVDACIPKYSFRRLDDPDSKAGKGWNFRYANYYYVNKTEYRDLIKAFGIRFIINVNGQAGKFSFVPLMFNLGSGLALLTIAAVFCDFITIYLLKNGVYYGQRKYLYVQDADAAVQALQDENTARGAKETTRETKPSQDALLQNKDVQSYESFAAANAQTDDSTSAPVPGEAVASGARHRPGEYNRLQEDD